MEKRRPLYSNFEGTALIRSKMAFTSICSPHDDLNDFHGCVTQSVEEIHQNLSFFSHLSNDKSKDKAEDNQAQDIYAVRIHAYDFVFLCFVLWIKTKRIY